METFLVVLGVLAFVGLLVWQFTATKNALATTRVESRYAPQEAAAMAMGAFAGARWAAFGGACTAWELLASEHRHGPCYDTLLTAAVNFLRANGVPPMRVKGYMWSHWVDQGGTTDTWIPRIATPSAAEAPITPLHLGELRRVAQLTQQPDSNVVLVRVDPGGTHVAVIDARKSDEDPRRSRWNWQSADSAHELYVAIALALQVPPYRCDPQLEPYFPIGRPLI